MSNTREKIHSSSSIEPRRRLGVLSITFLIIAASAPLTVIAGGVTTTFTVTHVEGVPLGYIVLAAALGIFAIGYAAMSRFVTNAGAFYAYISQGLGRPFGVGASLIALVSYNAMQIGIYGIFGFQVAGFIAEKTGAEIPWWVTVLVGIAIVGVFGVNRIDLSAKVLGILVIIEFVLVLIFDIAAFANPTEGTISGTPFSPAALFTPAVGAALSFGIAAFMGFEGAAIYGEEARDPKRTIPRATFLALAIIGVFYALSSWALALAIGPDKIVDPVGITPEEAGPPLFFNFVAEHVGIVAVDLMSIFFITSVFAALVSFHNAVARYTFSVAREGLLPRSLAKVAANGAPRAGSLVQTVTALIVIIGFAIGGIGSEYGPAFPVVTLFSWLPNAGALGLVLLMALVSLAVVGYFRGDARGVGVGSRLVAPVIAFLALATIFVLILTNFDVLLGLTEPSVVSYILPAIIIVPGVIGVIWGLLLRTSRPQIYANIGHGNDARVAAN